MSDAEAQHDFSEVITGIKRRHANVVKTMAEAVMAFRADAVASRAFSRREHAADEWRVQYFLERMFMNRIGLRMLINQYLIVFAGDMPRQPRLVGELRL